MILLRSRIIGFGKLRDVILDFQEKINLVFAANEGGKSTLQRFLTAMLYGQLRSDLRVQRRPDSWVEQYKPWHGVEYGGILWCRTADGREVEIHRSFGKDESHMEIRTAAGEDITSQYEQQRNGEVLFARHHFGMPKEIFESVGTIRENRVAEIHGRESIRDRIANLAQSGDEELSIRQSLQQIQQALDLIGTDRAPTKPYKQAQDLMQALQLERKALEDRREQFKSWLEERNRISGEISRMERELARAQSVLLNARRREVSSRVHSLEEIDKDIRALRAEIDSLGARPDFPSEKLEELNLLAGARDSIAKHLNELRMEKAAALEKLSRAEKERQQLSAYADFASSPEGEKITEWFVSYLSLSLQKDGIQKTLTRLREEMTALQKKLSELTPALRDSESDWQDMARQAAEDEQLAAQNCAALAERMAREKSAMISAGRAALQKRVLAAILAAMAAAPFGTPLIGVQLSILLKAGISGAMLIIAGILFMVAHNSAKTGRKAGAILLDLEAEQARIRDEGGKKRNKFNEVMTGSGFQRVDDFLAAARQSEQQRQKSSDLQARYAEAEQQSEKLESQSGEIYQLLKEGLAKVGLSCSPGSLKFQIDVLRSNLRRFRELDASYGSCLQKADSLTSEDADLTGEHDLKCSLIQSLLDEARVETPERFREECLKRQRFLELSEREASRTREFQRLAGSLTLAQWKDQLEELLNQQTPETEEDPAGPATLEAEPAPLLPYLPTIDEAEQEVRRIASQLSGMREEYARAVARTHHAFENFRPSFEIDEELALAEEKFRQLERNRSALGIALETLENLSRQQQEVLAPQLNSAVEQRFLKLCRERYEEVKIDPDFQVWVRELHTGELRLAEHLSRGTQDQLYFALRFGILDLVSSETEACPSFMDEPFAAYDSARLREAFEVLTGESERRQLFLFTCREDLLELAEHHGANVIRLAADNNS